jgi:hypothetical protein
LIPHNRPARPRAEDCPRTGRCRRVLRLRRQAPGSWAAHPSRSTASENNRATLSPVIKRLKAQRSGNGLSAVAALCHDAAFAYGQPVAKPACQEPVRNTLRKQKVLSRAEHAYLSGMSVSRSFFLAFRNRNPRPRITRIDTDENSLSVGICEISGVENSQHFFNSFAVLLPNQRYSNLARPQMARIDTDKNSLSVGIREIRGVKNSNIFSTVSRCYFLTKDTRKPGKTTDGSH